MAKTKKKKSKCQNRKNGRQQLYIFCVSKFRNALFDQKFSVHAAKQIVGGMNIQTAITTFRLGGMGADERKKTPRKNCMKWHDLMPRISQFID